MSNVEETPPTQPVVDASATPKMSKSAMKKLKKREAAAKKKAEKAILRAAQAAKKKAESKDDEADEENLDPTAYFDNRSRALEKLAESGVNPYPHKFNVTTSIPHFIHTFGSLANGDKDSKTEVSIAGRLFRKQKKGQNLLFYDVVADGQKLQVMADRRSDPEGFSIHKQLRRGDLVGFTGFAGRSKRGELSIWPTKSTLLAPCLRSLPSKHKGLQDKETRYRKRYLDLLFTPKTREIFYTRSKITNYIRRFLDERGFLEVETPMMDVQAGGAVAAPFITHHNDLDRKMYMRIAPELYLKKLIIGGLDRVYEIGRQFRNEGMDLTHNPEFTTCEFYWAYADYEDLMTTTEIMVAGMVKAICGDYKVQYHKDRKTGEAVTVDFTPPFKRISMMEGLEEAAGIKCPGPIESPETNEYLKAQCLKHEVKCSAPQTTARLLDKLVGAFLETQCTNPTFIINHPEIMSPLAKYHRSQPGVTERFELFVLEKEVANAYTELNNPKVQRERFANQLKDRALGDDEAMHFDEPFCVALEYGMPPTAGWGMGIDRMTMFLTDTDSIKEVLLFPAMKPEAQVNNSTAPTAETTAAPETAL